MLTITEPIACLAAMKTGRPVRYVYTREEEMRVSSTRSGNRIKILDGVMNDGRIVETGGPDLALELEAHGYAWIRDRVTPEASAPR